MLRPLLSYVRRSIVVAIFDFRIQTMQAGCCVKTLMNVDSILISRSLISLLFFVWLTAAQWLAACVM